MNLVVNIEKRLRDFTLRANFTLTDTTLALLGASGSGKSMTLKCIAGLETPDRGQVARSMTAVRASTSRRRSAALAISFRTTRSFRI